MPDGNVVMPAWKDRLSRAEVGDIVAWLHSLWPARVDRNQAVSQAGKLRSS